MFFADLVRKEVGDITNDLKSPSKSLSPEELEKQRVDKVTNTRYEFPLPDKVQKLLLACKEPVRLQTAILGAQCYSRLSRDGEILKAYS